jgi:dTDP-glucose pyrophosphorylase
MRINVIPMAGAGKRFADEGYATPKPFIEVHKWPMVCAAALALPDADGYVFLCREEHIREHNPEELFRSSFPKVTIIPVPELTEGQASTCLLARDVVPHDAELTIGACDNGMRWNKEHFAEKMADSSIDALIWTFRHFPPVAKKPEHYGWVVVDGDNRAERVLVKVPISDSPLEDHAIVGAFTFRRAGDFFREVKKMTEENRRINNEFYIDECMNLCIESGMRVEVFEVDSYFGWGTPNELKTYQYWQQYFSQTTRVS